MILCSHPNCQTTAGCVCNRLDPKAARIAELEAALAAERAKREEAATALFESDKARNREFDRACRESTAREAAEAEAARLREALGWFLNDDRFIVAVGGNPNVVDRMLAAARAALGGDHG